MKRMPSNNFDDAILKCPCLKKKAGFLSAILNLLSIFNEAFGSNFGASFSFFPTFIFLP
jgi:hypothetical protein